MSYYDPMVISAPQGWQCPICKRVYSPTTPMCYYCGGESVTTSSSTFTFTREGEPCPPVIKNPADENKSSSYTVCDKMSGMNINDFGKNISPTFEISGAYKKADSAR